MNGTQLDSRDALRFPIELRQVRKPSTESSFFTLPSRNPEFENLASIGEERSRKSPFFRYLRVLLAFIAIALPLNIAVAPAASAFDFCPFNVEIHGAGPGLPTGLDSLAAANSPGKAGVALTPAELYGSRLPLTSFTGEAGDSLPAECGLVQSGLNQVQNILLVTSQATASFVIGIYRWATNPSLFDGFLDPIDCLVGGRATGAQNCTGEGMTSTLFGNFLIVAIVLGALYMAWHGLVKKRSSEALQAVVWMAAFSAAVLVFMSQPSWFVKQTNQLVMGVSNIVLSATTALPSKAGGGVNMCALPNGDAVRESSCHLWRVFVYEPWKAAQFSGTAGNQKIAIEDEALREYVMNKFPHLGTNADDLTLAQLDATLVDTRELGNSNYEPVQDTDRFKVIIEQVKDEPWATAWAGRDSGGRFLTSILALAAGVLGGAIVTVFAFTALVYNVVLLVLIVVAPVIALLGVFPGTRRFAYKWLEMFIGTAVKRLVLAVLMAVLLGFYTLIAASNFNWFAKLILLCVFGVAAFLFRKPLGEAIKWGGDGAVEREAKKAGATTTQAAIGIATATAAGGGIGGAVAAASAAISKNYRTGGGSVGSGFREGIYQARQRKAANDSGPSAGGADTIGSSPSSSSTGGSGSSGSGGSSGGQGSSDSSSGSGSQSSEQGSGSGNSVPPPRPAPSGGNRPGGSGESLPTRCSRCGSVMANGARAKDGRFVGSYCPKCDVSSDSSGGSGSGGRPTAVPPTAQQPRPGGGGPGGGPQNCYSCKSPMIRTNVGYVCGNPSCSLSQNSSQGGANNQSAETSSTAQSGTPIEPVASSSASPRPQQGEAGGTSNSLPTQKPPGG